MLFIKTGISVIFLFTTFHVSATDFYSCKDENGNSVFSQIPCSSNAKRETINVYTPDIPTQIEEEDEQHTAVKQQEKRIVHRPKKVTDSCRKVSHTKLRNARVGEKLIRCHSQKDVTSIYGPPSRVHSWTDGDVYDTQWDYHFESGTAIFIYFKNDKVTDWSIHR